MKKEDIKKILDDVYHYYDIKNSIISRIRKEFFTHSKQISKLKNENENLKSTDREFTENILKIVELERQRKLTEQQIDILNSEIQDFYQAKNIFVKILQEHCEHDMVLDPMNKGPDNEDVYTCNFCGKIH